MDPPAIPAHREALIDERSQHRPFEPPCPRAEDPAGQARSPADAMPPDSRGGRSVDAVSPGAQGSEYGIGTEPPSGPCFLPFPQGTAQREPACPQTQLKPVGIHLASLPREPHHVGATVCPLPREGGTAPQVGQ